MLSEVEQITNVRSVRNEIFLAEISDILLKLSSVYLLNKDIPLYRRSFPSSF